ncbi:MAG: UDP-N-acetylmuramate dehydrogenase [Deltaproteobacteria bacterium]|nr:UDP-N-acetylmuramate dehydrogenase [Deltaproteobacteria bacterium]
MTNKALIREVEKAIACPVLYDESMKQHTSMGVGGKADVFFSPTGADELARIVMFLKDRDIPFVAVGNGTNVIVKDGGYRGAILSLKGLRKMGLEKRDAERHAVFAEAGVGLAALVQYCAEEMLTGLEFAAGIPGSVGGAVKMNAGAYGWEMKDVIEKVCLLNDAGGMRDVERAALKFEYRKLHLNTDEIIVGASFLLERGNRESIRAEISRILALRKDKHPLDYRSAGSIFKNPAKTPAGRLIEEAGLKGVRSGDAQVSEKHGNFIINLGQAKAADVLDLMAVVKKKVFEKKGIVLEEEVVILGED